MNLFLLFIPLLYLPLTATTIIDCNGKSFHCLNSTHFMICADVGGGVSVTIGTFVIQCPPTTFCDERNTFECEYQASTTQKSIYRDSYVPHELKASHTSTSAYDESAYTSNLPNTEESFLFPLQKYISSVNLSEFLEEDTVNATSDTSLYTTDMTNKIRNDTSSDRNYKLEYEIRTNNKTDSKNEESAIEKFGQTKNNTTAVTDQMNSTTEATTFFELASDSSTMETIPSVEFTTISGNFEDAVTPKTSVQYLKNTILNTMNGVSESQNSSNDFKTVNQTVPLATSIVTNDSVGQDIQKEDLISRDFIEIVNKTIKEENKKIFSKMPNDEMTTQVQYMMDDNFDSHISLTESSIIETLPNKTESLDIQNINQNTNMTNNSTKLQRSEQLLILKTSKEHVSNNLMHEGSIHDMPANKETTYTKNEILAPDLFLPDGVRNNNVILNTTRSVDINMEMNVTPEDGIFFNTTEKNINFNSNANLHTLEHNINHKIALKNIESDKIENITFTTNSDDIVTSNLSRNFQENVMFPTFEPNNDYKYSTLASETYEQNDMFSDNPLETTTVLIDTIYKESTNILLNNSGNKNSDIDITQANLRKWGNHNVTYSIETVTSPMVYFTTINDSTVLETSTKLENQDIVTGSVSSSQRMDSFLPAILHGQSAPFSHDILEKNTTTYISKTPKSIQNDLFNLNKSRIFENENLNMNIQQTTNPTTFSPLSFTHTQIYPIEVNTVSTKSEELTENNQVTQSTMETPYYLIDIQDTKINNNTTENRMINLTENVAKSLFDISNLVRSETQKDNETTKLELNSIAEMLSNNTMSTILENVTESMFNALTSTVDMSDKKKYVSEDNEDYSKGMKPTNYHTQEILVNDNEQSSNNSAYTILDEMQVNNKTTEMSNSKHVKDTPLDIQELYTQSTLEEPNYLINLNDGVTSSNNNYGVTVKLPENTTEMSVGVYTSIRSNIQETVTISDVQPVAGKGLLTNTKFPVFENSNTNPTMNTILSYTNKQISSSEVNIISEKPEGITDINEVVDGAVTLIPNLANNSYTDNSELFQTSIKASISDLRSIDKYNTTPDIPQATLRTTNANEDNNKLINGLSRDFGVTETIQPSTFNNNEIHKNDIRLTRKDGPVQNNTFNVMEYSTQSTLETSYYLINIKDTEMNDSLTESRTNNLAENMIKSSFDSNVPTKSQLNNISEMLNNITISTILENVTESIFNSPISTVDISDNKVTISEDNEEYRKETKSTIYYNQEIPVNNSDEPLNTTPYSILVETEVNNTTIKINNEKIEKDTQLNNLERYTQSSLEASNYLINLNDNMTSFNNSNGIIVNLLENATEMSVGINNMIGSNLQENKTSQVQPDGTKDMSKNVPFTVFEKSTETMLESSVLEANTKINKIHTFHGNNQENYNEIVSKDPKNITDPPIVHSTLINDRLVENQEPTQESRKNFSDIIKDLTTQNTLQLPVYIDNQVQDITKTSKYPNSLNNEHNVTDNVVENAMIMPIKIHTTDNAYLTTINSNFKMTNNILLKMIENFTQKAIETSTISLNEVHGKYIIKENENGELLNDTMVDLLDSYSQSTTTTTSSINNNATTNKYNDIKALNNYVKNETNEESNITTLLPKEPKVYNTISPNITTSNDSRFLTDFGLNHSIRSNKSLNNTGIDYKESADTIRKLEHNLQLTNNVNITDNQPPPGSSQINLEVGTTNTSTEMVDKKNKQIELEDIKLSQNNKENKTPNKVHKKTILTQNCTEESICSTSHIPPTIELTHKSIQIVNSNTSLDSKIKQMTQRLPTEDKNRIPNTNISSYWTHTESVTDKIVSTSERDIRLSGIDNENILNKINISKVGFQFRDSHIKAFNVTNDVRNSSQLNVIQTITNLTNKNEVYISQNQNRSHKISETNIAKTHFHVNVVKNELKKNIKNVEITSLKYIDTTTKSFSSQNSNSEVHEPIKLNISETNKSVISFECRNHVRGRFGDKNNCRKFYICIGYVIPIIGLCPVGTVFSEIRKQCTYNLSHCIRNNQFKCVNEGRFSDVWQKNVYYLCIKSNDHKFMRFKFHCRNGFILDKINMTCKTMIKLKSSSSSSSSNDEDIKNSSLTERSSSKKISTKNTSFKCEEEGKFVDPNNCKRYYVCSKTSKSALRRKRKKCDSDEVFHDDKKKCVDEDSHECL